jgi:2-methylisocitrate lyase-like PEP mutase family enzyme
VTAAALRALHVAGKPLVLPNAWDADSARLVEAAGFPAVATSSGAVAKSLGFEDGERAPVAEMFGAAARIVSAVSVPVTVDAESGYGLAPAEFVGRLLETGAVGCNFEDTAPGNGLRPVAEQAGLLAGIREAAGDSLVLNARVDAFLRASEEDAAFDDAVSRARTYLEAGADCVYPIHVRSVENLAGFVKAVAPAAVNATYLPGGPDLDGLAELGLARISLGTGLWKVTRSFVERTLADMARGVLPY